MKNARVSEWLAAVERWLFAETTRPRALGWPLAIALGVGLPALSFVAGLLVVVFLPADFFVREEITQGITRGRRALRLAGKVGKNLLGGLTFVAGFVMALPLVPGPGVLFMLIGLVLLDFPGKRALISRGLRQPGVLASVNRVRARFGKAPVLSPRTMPPSVVDNGP